MKKTLMMVFLLVCCLLSGAFAAGIDDNVSLNSYRIAKDNSHSILKMRDGVVDAFVDKCGVDESNSTNEVYISTLLTGNSNTVLLLDFEGDDGDVAMKDVSGECRDFIFYATTQLDTAVQKFGSSSLELDGDSDYVQAADSDAWDFFANTTDDWTIDFWVKHDTSGILQYYMNQTEGASVNNQWAMFHHPSVGFVVQLVSGGSTLINTGDTNSNPKITDTNWHHVALIKKGNKYGVYMDGDKALYFTDSDTDTYSGPFQIGQRGDGVSYLDGHIDEFRISKSNIFNANPDTDGNDAFTVPSSSASPRTNSAYYSPAVSTNLTLISKAFTAKDNVTKARIAVLEEDISAVTLNTDIKAYVSRQNSTNWNQITLTDEGDYDSSGRRILSGEITSFTGTADNDMVYKIETLNSKNLKLHGVSLSWE